MCMSVINVTLAARGPQIAHQSFICAYKPAIELFQINGLSVVS